MKTEIVYELVGSDDSLQSISSTDIVCITPSKYQNDIKNVTHSQSQCASCSNQDRQKSAIRSVYRSVSNLAVEECRRKCKRCSSNTIDAGARKSIICVRIPRAVQCSIDCPQCTAPCISKKCNSVPYCRSRCFLPLPRTCRSSRSLSRSCPAPPPSRPCPPIPPFCYYPTPFLPSPYIPCPYSPYPFSYEPYGMPCRPYPPPCKSYPPPCRPYSPPCRPYPPSCSPYSPPCRPYSPLCMPFAPCEPPYLPPCMPYSPPCIRPPPCRPPPPCGPPPPSCGFSPPCRPPPPCGSPPPCRSPPPCGSPPPCRPPPCGSPPPCRRPPLCGSPPPCRPPPPCGPPPPCAPPPPCGPPPPCRSCSNPYYPRTPPCSSFSRPCTSDCSSCRPLCPPPCPHTCRPHSANIQSTCKPSCTTLCKPSSPPCLNSCNPCSHCCSCKLPCQQSCASCPALSFSQKPHCCKPCPLQSGPPSDGCCNPLCPSSSQGAHPRFGSQFSYPPNQNKSALGSTTVSKLRYASGAVISNISSLPPQASDPSAGPQGASVSMSFSPNDHPTSLEISSFPNSVQQSYKLPTSSNAPFIEGTTESNSLSAPLSPEPLESTQTQTAMKNDSGVSFSVGKSASNVAMSSINESSAYMPQDYLQLYKSPVSEPSSQPAPYFNTSQSALQQPKSLNIKVSSKEYQSGGASSSRRIASSCPSDSCPSKNSCPARPDPCPSMRNKQTCPAVTLGPCPDSKYAQNFRGSKSGQDICPGPSVCPQARLISKAETRSGLPHKRSTSLRNDSLVYPVLTDFGGSPMSRKSNSSSTNKQIPSREMLPRDTGEEKHIFGEETPTVVALKDMSIYGEERPNTSETLLVDQRQQEQLEYESEQREFEQREYAQSEREQRELEQRQREQWEQASEQRNRERLEQEYDPREQWDADQREQEQLKREYQERQQQERQQKEKLLCLCNMSTCMCTETATHEEKNIQYPAYQQGISQTEDKGDAKVQCTCTEDVGTLCNCGLPECTCAKQNSRSQGGARRQDDARRLDDARRQDDAQRQDDLCQCTSSATNSTSSTFKSSSGSSQSYMSCICCKKEKMFKSLTNKLALCSPCQKVNQKSFYPYNYSNPLHSCVCYSLVDHNLLCQLKDTLTELERLEIYQQYSKILQNCKSCRKCGCKCKIPKKNKKGVAYFLKLENGCPNTHCSEYGEDQSEFSTQYGEDQDARSLPEVTVKVPNCKGSCAMMRDGKKGGNKRNKSCPSIQTYLWTRKPDFIYRAERRRKILRKAVLEREEDVEDRKIKFAERMNCLNHMENMNIYYEKNSRGSYGNPNNAYFVPDLSFSNPSKIVKPRVFKSFKEMKELTRKRYLHLPEVKNKKNNYKEMRLREANRLLANTFTKRLQRSTLRGNVDIPSNLRVISY